MADSTDKSYWIRKAFHDFDEAGEGMLTMEGLKCAITALLGSRPTKVRNGMPSLSLPSLFCIMLPDSGDQTREQCILSPSSVFNLSHLSPLYRLQYQVNQLFVLHNVERGERDDNIP